MTDETQEELIRTMSELLEKNKKLRESATSEELLVLSKILEVLERIEKKISPMKSVAAYLGGHLVYKEQLGVDHTADFSPPDDFVPALADSELRDDQLRRVDVNGMPVLLVRKGAHIYAMAERCSHLGGPLSEGKLEGHAVRCPWHGSCFSLEDGRVLEGPSVHAQPILEARVRNGHIEVRGANVF